MEFQSVRGEVWSQEEVASKLRGVARLDPKVERVARHLTVELREGDWDESYQTTQGRKELNHLHGQILASEDKKLIALFQRALRNFSAVYPHQVGQKEPLQAFTFYKKHYLEPAFCTPQMHVTLDVKEEHVEVTTRLVIERVGEEGSLILDGREHRVKGVKVEGRSLYGQEYYATEHELILPHPPKKKRFEMEITSVIDPFNNTSNEGLYPTNGWLVSQCESEGARRIFHTVDAPINRCEWTTTIIADPSRFPKKLSNGNLIEERQLDDGRELVTWHNPHKDPTYIYAVGLGDFDVEEGSFTTREGREVQIQGFCEKGKGERIRFAVESAKWSMEFDEKFFDRIYDLDNLKVQAVPDFNAGAMENKGYLIFNDRCCLADPSSATDRGFYSVAYVMMHEYAHNYSGNRVTIKNFFEPGLKEAFTDFRAMLFMEWLWGADYVRPLQVQALWEGQFPEDQSPDRAHSINAHQYVTSGELYDATTYVKGREVFRVLWALMEGEEEGLFRRAQNEYFRRYDYQSITFEQFMEVMREVSGMDLIAYERWFNQAGLVHLYTTLDYDRENKRATLHLRQSCPHPQTGEEQDAVHIPVGVELMSQDGKTLVPQHTVQFTETSQKLVFEGIDEEPTPLLLHGYSAPVKLEYPYTQRELETVILYSEDAFCRWHASQSYLQGLVRQQMEMGREGLAEGALETMKKALRSEKLGPVAKARLLQLPSERAVLQGNEVYDYPRAAQARRQVRQLLAQGLESELKELLEQHPAPEKYDPYSKKEFVKGVGVRELRGACMGMLACLGSEDLGKELESLYYQADNYTEKTQAMRILANSHYAGKEGVLDHFAQEYAEDVGCLNDWISAQAGGSDCTVEELHWIRAHPAFKVSNANHVRSLARVFAGNVGSYHDSEGMGYSWMADLILEIEKKNSALALGLCRSAWIDYNRIPQKQKKLMAQQLERIAQQARESSVREVANRVIRPLSVT